MCSSLNPTNRFFFLPVQHREHHEQRGEHPAPDRNAGQCRGRSGPPGRAPRRLRGQDQRGGRRGAHCGRARQRHPAAAEQPARPARPTRLHDVSARVPSRQRAPSSRLRPVQPGAHRRLCLSCLPAPGRHRGRAARRSAPPPRLRRANGRTGAAQAQVLQWSLPAPQERHRPRHQQAPRVLQGSFFAPSSRYPKIPNQTGH